MTGAHQWEEQRRRKIRGQEPRLGRTANPTQIYSERGELLVMDIALAIVDIPAQYPYLPEQNPLAQNKTDRGCGLTARKDGNYQYSSSRKRRRHVPADWVYYIQSAYSFQ